MSLTPLPLIEWFQNMPTEALILVMMIACGISILMMVRLFGAAGLVFYNALAVIIANIQVQVATFFHFYGEPIALGTVVFSSIFLSTNILTEYYGKEEAQKGVWLSFTGMILIISFMVLTLGFNPAPGFDHPHQAISILFTPAPALLAASLIAYLLGQFNDIWIFSTLSRLTQGRLLWLRTVAATLIGAFIDSVIFSVLAWVIFAPHPLSWTTVIYTYILGAYMLRVMVLVVGLPFVYGAREMVRT